MEFKKYHRKYPDSKWEYKAISTKVTDEKTYRMNEIIYYTVIDKGKKRKGVEVYSGENYILDSPDRSYSRSYSMENVPEKYQSIVDELIDVYNSTTWSKEPYVDFN